jgi:glycosyltransferase involved in cell wall biosynthesis
MKILTINKFYFLFGGTERYLFNLTEVLESMGHLVIPFSMHHERNQNTKYSKYFVSKVDLSIDRKLILSNEIKSVGRILYSFEAKRKLQKLIEVERPDIAHVRNVYHQLSPSVLSVLKKMNIPSVLTVADYKLICPNYDMFYDCKPCEACKNGAFYHAIVKRCVRQSLPASVLLATESTFHRFVLDSYVKNIDLFISPSKFMQKKLIESGFPKEKVFHLPHFCDSSKWIPSYDFDNYLVYFGRIDHRKGLLTLIKAVRNLPTKLVIMGEGPEKKNLEKYIAMEAISNVFLVGYKSGEELKIILRKAMFSVLPSEWYEPFGHTILESFASGKPVIASKIGGITELIKEGENGHLFEPGNVNQLRDRINDYLSNPIKVKKMGKIARSNVKKNYNPEDHYQKLLTIYRNLMS